MINRPRQILYDYWSEIANLPTFMETVKSVEILESGRSKWIIAGPAGNEVELVSEITFGARDLSGGRVIVHAAFGDDFGKGVERPGVDDLAEAFRGGDGGVGHGDSCEVRRR